MSLSLARRLAGIGLAATLLAGCAVERPAADDPATITVTVMAFNVENLFDNVDAPGKNDEIYLPVEAKRSQAHIDKCNAIPVDRWREQCLELDWNDAVVGHKLSAVADTIRHVDGGHGPDIVALQEVENIAILERLRREYLADLGYGPGILIEGDDLRGIDVAFLSRLPLARAPVLHPLALPAFPDRAGDTRGVLQADFLLPNGAVLTGFSVHFPAPFHPTGMRAAAYEHLNGLLDALPDGQHAFAAGDFNTTSREDAEQSMLDRFARPRWIVAHDVGCAGCKGTSYYRRDDSWSFLDMILFAPGRGADTTARLRADTVRIAAGNPQQTRPDGTPQRYDAAARRGVSDHWPIVAAIEVTRKQ